MVDKFFATIMGFLERNKRYPIWVVLSFALLAYSNVFRNGFVMDDHDFIVNWPLIQDWKNLYRFFIHYIPPDAQIGIYSPLKTVFHALTYHLFKENPLGYHITAFLIHGLSTWFVYKLIDLLTNKRIAAFVGALIFAVHPVQVEAVGYLTASIDMIGVLFFFVSFYFFIKAAQDGSDKKNYFLSLGFGGLAIFTHELTISLPLLLLFYDICFYRQKASWRKITARAAPFAGIVLFYTIAKYLVLGSITRGGYLYDSFYLTMLLMIKAWAKYVFLVFCPLVLNVNQIISKGIFSWGADDFDKFSVLSQSLLDRQVLVSLAGLGILLYWAVRYFRSKPLITFCIGWFFICLLPGSNIIPSGVYFGERYLYPGLPAFCLLAGMFFEQMRSRFRRSSILVLAALIIFYMGRTWVRNHDWRNELAFYESSVRDNPQSAFMRRDLGLLYLQKGMLQEALANLEEANELKPHNVDILFPLAEVQMETGDWDSSRKSLEVAVLLDEDFPEGFFNLAVLSGLEGKADEAKEYLGRSVSIYAGQSRLLEADQAKKAFYNYFYGLEE